ncbi:325_t:CDS:2 [Funneliformis mosseae]|uniref:325_t:CDS:1 n=1 Tax=Funneliformis mosseae TaxID=27381 RepID=A0A9N9F682_FUNMO|nr:325_t:CDS:2 [Funneliformis mosseae]
MDHTIVKGIIMAIILLDLKAFPNIHQLQNTAHLPAFEEVSRTRLPIYSVFLFALFLCMFIYHYGEPTTSSDTETLTDLTTIDTTVSLTK